MLQADGLQDMPEQEPKIISNDNIGRCLNSCLTPSARAWKGNLLTVHWHALTLTPLDGQILSHCKWSSCMYADTEHEDPIDEPADDVAPTTAACHQERTSTDVHARADSAAAQAPAAEDEAPAAIPDASDPVASAPPHTNPLQPETANTPLSSSSPSAESDRCYWHAWCTLARRRMCSIIAVTALNHLSNCMRNHFYICFEFSFNLKQGSRS